MYRNITKLLYLKWKLKEKKKKKDEKKKKKKKGSEEKKIMSGIEHGTSDDPGQSFPTGPRGKRTGRCCGNFIIKTFKSY